MDAREVLARKLRALMRDSGKYTDRELLGRAAGISARNVGYMLQKTGNPTLKSIQAVAKVFGLDAWELLIDSGTARDRLMSRFFGQADRWKPGDPERRREDRRSRLN
jgi:transcriptional regulator with XRE-family HTH domain